MRPRPSVVSAALILLALVHAWWGLRILARGDLLFAMSQLVSAGSLLLAGAAATSRATFSTAMGIAAAATALRILGMFPPGPWLVATALLALGMGLAAWGARRLDGPGRIGMGPAALRGGFVLMACAYAAFLAFGFAFGSTTLDRLDLVARIGAALAIASFLDAPRIELPKGKALARDAPMQGQ